MDTNCHIPDLVQAFSEEYGALDLVLWIAKLYTVYSSVILPN